MKMFTFNRRQFLATAVLPSLLGSVAIRAGASQSTPADHALDEWIVVQRRLSTNHLLQNISPAGPVERDVESVHIAADRLADARRAAALSDGLVRLDGGRLRQKIVPRPGSVAGAALGKLTEPDYFFHWIRDSSLVMREFASLYGAGPAAVTSMAEQRLADFIRFSRELQMSAPAEGLGETRFNLDGGEDFLQWSRPQFDGPPLRALTLMYYRKMRTAPLEPDLDEALKQVIRADVDYVAANWPRDGFDLWEEYKGHDFHARAVQIGALREGARWALVDHDRERADRYAAAELRLREALEDHWLPTSGYHGFLLGPRVYWDGTNRPKPGDNLDAAVVMAALHGRLSDGRYSLLDDRILATAIRSEDVSAMRYAINARRGTDEGVLYGRYDGDNYFGGNPFAFITLEFAESHYQLATLLARRTSLAITSLNRPFFERALRRAGIRVAPEAGGDVLAHARTRHALLRGLILRGDDILRMVKRLTPESGELPEQYDQETGAAASCPNLSWSHSSFLAATHARVAALARVGP